MAVVLIFLVPLVFLVLAFKLFEGIMNAMGLRRFSDFPLILKRVFYSVWVFFNIAGLCVIFLYFSSLRQGRSNFFDAHPGLIYLVMVLFYPFIVALWRYVDDRRTKPTMAILGMASLLACCGLFLLAILTFLYMNDLLPF